MYNCEITAGISHIEDIVQGILKSTNKIPKYKRKFDYKNPRLAESSAPLQFIILEMEKKLN